MSIKKLAAVLLVSGVTCVMIGCGGSKHQKTACNDVDNCTGVQSVAAFDGEVLSPEQETNLVSQRVLHFAYDDSSLSSANERVLTAHAQYMLDHPSMALTIKGHTDERGSRDYNVALGERRANSVGRFLETKGVPSNRLTMVSYGKEQPVNLESNEAAWAENRRAELDYNE